ncbi:MAG: hypothetical protein KJ672_03015, partial [Candidatus Thermoplasmatota archaeon]|nr:hypothetical protein [Candidatus Thermoplasmatota archaeon]
MPAGGAQDILKENIFADCSDFGGIQDTLSEHAQNQDVKTLAKTAFDLLTTAVYVANTPALQSQSAYGLGVWFPTSYRSLGNANIGGFST